MWGTRPQWHPALPGQPILLDPATLAMVFKNRSRDHASNAYLMLYEPEALTARAGQGVRQGFAHAGPLEI